MSENKHRYLIQYTYIAEEHEIVHANTQDEAIEEFNKNEGDDLEDVDIYKVTDLGPLPLEVDKNQLTFEDK